MATDLRSRFDNDVFPVTAFHSSKCPSSLQENAAEEIIQYLPMKGSEVSQNCALVEYCF